MVLRAIPGGRRVQLRQRVRRPMTQRALALGIATVLALLATSCQWAQYMGDAALNGAVKGGSGFTTANIGSTTQTFTIPTGGPTDQVSSPVVADGKVFAVDYDGQLVAANDGTGTGCSGTPVVCQPLWESPAGLFGTDPESPPDVANGVVYVTTSDGGPGELEAFDENGVTNCSGVPTVCQPLWTASAVSLGGPNVVDGKVFVDTVNNGLEVFDASGVTNCSGSPKVCQPLWTGPSRGFSEPSVAAGRVYVVDFLYDVVAAYDENGVSNCSGTPSVCQPLFTVPLPHSTSPPKGSVDVSAGIGYVLAGATPGNVLVAFDATGTQGCASAPVVCQPLWESSELDPATISTPAVGNGTVYVTGTDAIAYAFDANGQTDCSGTPVTCAPEVAFEAPHNTSYQYVSPTVAGGVLFIGGDAYDATGSVGCSPGTILVCTPLWSIPNGRVSSTAVSNGTAYVGGSDGMVHAYSVLSS